MLEEKKIQLSPLLLNILRRVSLSPDNLPHDNEHWQSFLICITNLINDFDQERYLLERSMELSSREMRELYERFESAQAIASIGYWYHDRNEERIIWSKQTYKIFGFDSADSVPHFDILMQYIHEDDRDNLLKLIERAFVDGEDYEAEVRIYHMPDRKIRWLYVKGHPEKIQQKTNPQKENLQKENQQNENQQKENQQKENQQKESLQKETQQKENQQRTTQQKTNQLINSQQKFAYSLSGMVMDITARKHSENHLKRLNQQLIDISRLAGMAEIATSVLHNIGNVLNSLNISVTLIQENIKNSEINNLIKLGELINENIKNLPEFLISDDKGKLIPKYLRDLSKNLLQEHEKINVESINLQKNIQHMKDIVLMQKDISGISDVAEQINLEDIIETAINMGCDESEKLNININKKYNFKPNFYINKYKLLQILVHLIRNAKEALVLDPDNENKNITILTNKNSEDSCIDIEVKDNGVGIKSENFNKIFSMGFTTKIGGHGFGLHSSALSAKELGGSLKVYSDGEGKGAVFLLKIPMKSNG